MGPTWCEQVAKQSHHSRRPDYTGPPLEATKRQVTSPEKKTEGEVGVFREASWLKKSLEKSQGPGGMLLILGGGLPTRLHAAQPDFYFQLNWGQHGPRRKKGHDRL